MLARTEGWTKRRLYALDYYPLFGKRTKKIENKEYTETAKHSPRIHQLEYHLAK